jgi:hypothetical protein
MYLAIMVGVIVVVALVTVPSLLRKRCVSCGTRNSLDARMCVKCGVAFPEEPPRGEG